LAAFIPGNEKEVVFEDFAAEKFPDDCVWFGIDDVADGDTIILVDGMEMLHNYVKKLPKKVSCVLAGSSRPTSVIYKNPKGLSENVIAKDNTVAIRIVHDEFCQRLIQAFGKPIVSTSANYSGKASPKCFDDIDRSLLNKVDYVVNLHRDEKQNRSSQLVKISDKGRIEFLRK
jgi:L-threonylcarbamoyladenylate synthase